MASSFLLSHQFQCLVNMRTAIENQRKEHSEQRGEQDGPADAASPGKKQRSHAFLD